MQHPVWWENILASWFDCKEDEMRWEGKLLGKFKLIKVIKGKWRNKLTSSMSIRKKIRS